MSDKTERTMGNTIKEVFLGNEATGKEGMIPSNVFKAMVHTDILPLIFFSLLIGAALSMLGDMGKPVVSVIAGFKRSSDEARSLDNVRRTGRHFRLNRGQNR